MTKKINKVVLAYSGGLDTSVILKWIKETYQCEVIAFSANIGQEEELDNLEEKALKTGASKVYIEDLRESFVNDYVFPAFRANAIYEGQYLLGTSLARPLIAKRQIEIAKIEGADAVSHGATGKGNDQVRFELSYLSLNPGINIIAPWRIWNLNSRTELLKYAEKHGIEISKTQPKPYSSDRNLLHISYEGEELEDPWKRPDESMFTLTNSLKDAPDESEIIDITFEYGNPVAINNKPMSGADLLYELNKLGGKHGIGRIDMVENRFVGMKSRGVYETPGGTILRTAHINMESITMDREVMHLRDSLIPKYSQLIYNGFWFAPEMKILQQFIDSTQQDVSGVVKLELYKGNCTVIGRKSDKSLYNYDYATFEDDEVYNQKDATGFIKLQALRLKIRSLLEEKQL